MRPVLESPIPYPGSKRRLVPTLLKILPPHRVYVEPMIGGGSLFFAKPPAEKSVIGDLDKGLVRFYKSFDCGNLRACSAKVTNLCSFAQESFAKMKNQQATPCETLAARRFSVVSAGHGLKRKECKVRPLLPQKLADPTRCAAYENVLKRATVVHADALETAKKHDSANTFTYFDPPYFGDISREYIVSRKETLSPDQLCEFARRAKGKVLISTNDTHQVRRACRGLVVREIPVKYGMRRVTRADPHAKELLISNFPLPPRIV